MTRKRSDNFSKLSKSGQMVTNSSFLWAGLTFLRRFLEDFMTNVRHGKLAYFQGCALLILFKIESKNANYSSTQFAAR